jgi:tellurite resistance protein TerC
MIWLWIAFLLLVFVFLALDLGVFNRHAHVISVKEALRWTGIWIAVALLFNVVVYFIYEYHWFGMQGFIRVLDKDTGQMVHTPATGFQMALQFLAGYIIEKSLSMDNIFVIAVIFGYFKVPPKYQHRVLFWGILGALIMRGAMIALGAVMIKSFSWTIYLFGGLLIVTAIRMLLSGDEHGDPNNNWLIKLARKIYPVADEYDGQKFFTVANGKRAMTKLMLVLLVVESTDVLFAVDSIPAIFAVTEDPFIVFTSNVFAILGLRSLYFALAGMIDQFRYLKPSLVFVLAFVGVKMIISHHYPLPTWVSLAVIVGILAVGIVASLMAPAPKRRPSEPAPIDMAEEKETTPGEGH